MIPNLDVGELSRLQSGDVGDYSLEDPVNIYQRGGAEPKSAMLSSFQ